MSPSATNPRMSTSIAFPTPSPWGGDTTAVSACPSQSLFGVMMREVLTTRTPNDRVDGELTQLYQENPELFDVLKMPVTLTSGESMGATPPF
jgi:hypothetical protein